MTVFTSTQINISAPMAQVRCRSCSKLIFRWRYSGVAQVEMKCPRCGKIETITLST